MYGNTLTLQGNEFSEIKLSDKFINEITSGLDSGYRREFLSFIQGKNQVSLSNKQIGQILTSCFIRLTAKGDFAYGKKPQSPAEYLNENYGDYTMVNDYLCMCEFWTKEIPANQFRVAKSDKQIFSKENVHANMKAYKGPFNLTLGLLATVGCLGTIFMFIAAAVAVGFKYSTAF